MTQLNKTSILLLFLSLICIPYCINTLESSLLVVDIEKTFNNITLRANKDQNATIKIQTPLNIHNLDIYSNISQQRIAYATKDNFNLTGEYASSKKIEARIEFNDNRIFYVLTTINLTYADQQTLSIHVTFEKNSSRGVAVVEKKRINIIINVYGAPEYCNSKKLHFNRNQTKAKVALCGNPKPRFYWYIDEMFLSRGDVKNIHDQKYLFTIPISKKSVDWCGRTLNFIAPGYNDIKLQAGVTLMFKFTPEPINVTSVIRKDNCITTSWIMLETGNCYANYTLNLLDHQNHTIRQFEVKNTHQIEHCFDDKLTAKRITYIEMHASNDGNHGSVTYRNVEDFIYIRDFILYPSTREKVIAMCSVLTAFLLICAISALIIRQREQEALKWIKKATSIRRKKKKIESTSPAKESIVRFSTSVMCQPDSKVQITSNLL